jgi:hypothetical protein
MYAYYRTGGQVVWKLQDTYHGTIGKRACRLDRDKIDDKGIDYRLKINGRCSISLPLSNFYSKYDSCRRATLDSSD